MKVELEFEGFLKIYRELTKINRIRKKHYGLNLADFCGHENAINLIREEFQKIEPIPGNIACINVFTYPICCFSPDFWHIFVFLKMQRIGGCIA